MSHAWNACGFHDPRGFKSHILRHVKSRDIVPISVSRDFSFSHRSPDLSGGLCGKSSKISSASPKVCPAGASTKNMVPFYK